MPKSNDRTQARKYETGRDWSIWPAYEEAKAGLKNYWYPVAWASEVDKKPVSIRVCATNIVLMRGQDGKAKALNDRCPHRGVKLSQGIQEFPDTITCPYHGWTYNLNDGELVAVLTDGPDSRMCGAVAVKTYPTEEQMGLIWVFVGDGPVYPLDQQLPAELVNPPAYVMGGRIEDRDGNWRFYAENGFDEGHAKYLHRTAWWRAFKVMPTWNRIHIEREGNWLFRIEDERHWSAVFPGLGKWTNERWWKQKPKQRQGASLGNTGGSLHYDPYIKAQDFKGFASIALPGMLRIAYPQYIHYEFYVPIDENRTKYVGFMVQFKSGLQKYKFYFYYLSLVRWLFHGQFSGQDHWMVAQTDAPPERLYRPDISLIEWRNLFAQPHPVTGHPNTGATPAPACKKPDGAPA